VVSPRRGGQVLQVPSSIGAAFRLRSPPPYTSVLQHLRNVSACFWSKQRITGARHCGFWLVAVLVVQLIISHTVVIAAHHLCRLAVLHTASELPASLLQMKDIGPPYMPCRSARVVVRTCWGHGLQHQASQWRRPSTRCVCRVYSLLAAVCSRSLSLSQHTTRLLQLPLDTGTFMELCVI
jgi:hypothetical protein